MTREEAIKILKEHHDHWMRLLKEGICTEEEGENTIEALEMGIKALKQMPVTTTAGEGGVIYYPQVEGVTPTVVDVGKQEPCDTYGYEEGSIYCKERCPHEAKIEQETVFFPPCQDCNTKMDEIRRAYDKLQEPSGDTISRKIISAFLSGLISDDVERKKALEYINELPSVNLMPCEDAISRQAVLSMQYRIDDSATLSTRDVVNVDDIEDLPPVTPQPKIGHWVGVDGKPSHLKDGMTTESVWCSECGKWLTASDEYSCDGKFCPSCGVRMPES